MLSNNISQNLKRLRKQRGISLEKISKLADLSLNTVIKIESGTNKNPTIDTLTKLAFALQAGVDDLIKPIKQ